MKSEVVTIASSHRSRRGMKVVRVRVRRRRTGVRASRVTAQNREEVCDHLGGGRRAARPSPRLGGLRERASAPPQPPPPPPGAGFEPTTACCDARGAAARALLTPRRIILRRRRVRRRGGCQRRSRRLRRGRPTQPVTAQLGSPELELMARRDSAAAAELDVLAQLHNEYTRASAVRAARHGRRRRKPHTSVRPGRRGVRSASTTRVPVAFFIKRTRKGESSTVIIEAAPPLFWSLPSSLLPSPPLPSPPLPSSFLSFLSPFPSLYVVWPPA